MIIPADDDDDASWLIVASEMLLPQHLCYVAAQNVYHPNVNNTHLLISILVIPCRQIHLVFWQVRTSAREIMVFVMPCHWCSLFSSVFLCKKLKIVAVSSGGCSLSFA